MSTSGTSFPRSVWHRLAAGRRSPAGAHRRTSLSADPVWAGYAALGLAALVAVSSAVRLARPTGWLGSDDAGYYSAAEHILTGSPIERVHHHYARLAVILPVAASLTLFGDHPTAVWVPSFVASLACVLLVAVIGRLLWNWRTGILAGAIVSLVPYFRILSTAGYPDVHACLWTTGSVLLAILAVRYDTLHSSTREPRGTFDLVAVLFLASGFTAGLAGSAKIFAAPVVVAIACAALFRPGASARRRMADLGAVVLGGAVFVAIEGLIYHAIAGDFFFTLHAHARAVGTVEPASGSSLSAGPALPGAAGVWSIWTLAAERLWMPFRTSTSGWGALGVLFWPVMVAGLLSRRARVFPDRAGSNTPAGPGLNGPRILAVWGLSTFLGVAFMPVGFENGVRFNPIFHGRHVLPAVVPFALCLAWIVDRLAATGIGRLIASNANPSRQRPMRTGMLTARGRSPFAFLHATATAGAFAAVLVAAYADRRQLNGFVDRETSRLGRAISTIVATRDWPDDRPIFMPPSLYWRYRILFPAELRDRMRVAADDRSPEWWKQVCPDIVARRAPMPSSRDAYLLATPTQLSGTPEFWDYGVLLPESGLKRWGTFPPAVVAVRGERSSIHLIGDGPDRDAALASPRAIVALLGPVGDADTAPGPVARRPMLP